MNIVCIIQARMSSTRLPGKVLMQAFNQKEMLKIMHERVSNSQLINEIIIATSTNDSDNVIEQFCQNNNIKYFRGSLMNVLDRYYQCVKLLIKKPDYIIRLTADCPIICPQNIDNTIKHILENKSDYVSSRTTPDGMDCEIFTYKALESAWNNAKTDFEKEHVTQYIRINEKNISFFNIDNDYSKIRITLDYPEDFEVISRIYQILYLKNPNFDMYDIINCYIENKFNLINGKYVQNN